MKNNAKVGGILSIIAGYWGLLSALILILFGILALVIRSNEYSDFYPGWSDYVFAVFFLVCGFFCGLLGAFAILGGAFALKRRAWGLALAGSIAGILTFWLCGIPAVIFTAMAKPEFGANTAPQSPAPPPEKIVG
jgi:intracellular septation protein A